MTTQNAEQTEQNPNLDNTKKRPFVEPEISDPVDVFETTAFFQGVTGGTDVTGDIT